MSGRQQLPPWDYEFSDERVACLMCGQRERTVIVAERKDVGLCEACVVHLYWEWKKLPDDAEPSVPKESRIDVERVKVLLPRLLHLEDGSLGSPEVPESYELAVAFRADGGVDLPSVDLLPQESCTRAAARALEQHGVLTWPCFVEPLYSALSPRGRLSRVMLVTAYTTWARGAGGSSVAAPAAAGVLQWRQWPPWTQEGMDDLGALYLALRDVWPLRIWKYVAREPRTSEIATCVRRAAAEYIYMLQDLRSKLVGVDTSAAELMRRSMSDDEKLVVRVLSEQERNQAERSEQEKPAEEAEAAGDIPNIDEEGDLPEEDLSPGDLGAESGVDDPFDESA